MRTHLLVLTITTWLFAATATAGPLTLCTGSWDGPGLTACELLGRPGVIGGAREFSFTGATLTPVWEITAYDQSNTLQVLANGALQYQPRAHVAEVFRSDDPITFVQFALWRQDDEVWWIGVEDLTSGDFDYNDYIVQVTRPSTPVPETGTPGMFALGLAALYLIRRRLTD